MKLNVAIEYTPSNTMRARQIESLFDVPAVEKMQLRWEGNVPIEDRSWCVGLIVGPSGSGKSVCARQLFGDNVDRALQYNASSVLDDISQNVKVDEIAETFSAVGFNTIPAWLRPHSALSNGEKFRADIARRFLELNAPIVVDEFTSVVDRQVAKVCAYSIQKLARRKKKQFVAVSCHYDVIDWLQPDWVLELPQATFSWRKLQRRPTIQVEIARCDKSWWKLFAPFHYLTASLVSSAKCFLLTVNDRPAAFSAVKVFPHPKVKNIVQGSRAVVLPDWQGLGLAFVLREKIASAYAAFGKRFRGYPAHPSFVHAHQRSKNWKQVKQLGTYQAINFNERLKVSGAASLVKGRPCATFEYIGPKMENVREAAALIYGHDVFESSTIKGSTTEPC